MSTLTLDSTIGLSVNEKDHFNEIRTLSVGLRGGSHRSQSLRWKPLGRQRGRKPARVLGTILCLVALVWAVSHGGLIRRKAKIEQATESIFEVHALPLAVSVAVKPALSLHLLWMARTSFLLNLATVIFPPPPLDACIPARVWRT
jgi:hypothetical protein